MPRVNSLKQRLLAREHSLGAFLLTSSADNAEILSHLGFDFLVIDHEHGSGCLTHAIEQMRAINGSATSSMVRVSALDPAHLRRTLDAGIQCILAPMIESASAAKAIVEACWYPPHGTRGAGGGIRASRYGLDWDFLNGMRKELLIGVQIESIKGVENVDEIAAVTGVDLLVIGPRDLSASIGKLGQFDDPEVLQLVQSAESAILASGKSLGSVVYPGRTADDMFASGYGLLIAGSDVSFLIEGARLARSAR